MKFKTPYQEFIYTRTYSRFDWEKGRREYFPESVERYFKFMMERVPKSRHDLFLETKDDMLGLEAMPSMRALWSAGPALERENIAGYNCAATVIDNIESFHEIMYILLCGGGVGYSVERKFVEQLPKVPEVIKREEFGLIFEDSKEGWAGGFNTYLKSLFVGSELIYDLSKIRPEGAVLRTFGGRASGPEPLRLLLEFTKATILNARGRKLTPIECHDICCYIGNVVVSGGVRRSALLSLSNLTDLQMRRAKEGNFYDTHPYRAMANNSVCYTRQPDMRTFLEEWLELMASGSGERGIFNREACNNLLGDSRRTPHEDFVCNPCSEIILRPKQFCNLSEVVVRKTDTLSRICDKVRSATILGTIQGTLTDFGVIGSEWKANCDEERLLGVSLTGIYDHPILSGNKGFDRLEDWLNTMKLVAQKTNKKWAKYLGVPQSAAITCVKPSGTVSQLVNSASGIHPRYSRFYLRRVEVSPTDPLAKMMIEQGVPHFFDGETKVKFEFPTKGPAGTTERHEVSALDQLNLWKQYQSHWCEHKPSMTVYVRDNEWLETGAWVYKNWNSVSGISFLPYDAGVYVKPPYEEIDESTYRALNSKFPKIDFTMLPEYESEDYTEGSREIACQGGACEV